MMSGDFPPSSRDTFFKLLCAQLVMIVFPTGVDPVKPNLRTSGWSAMPCPTTPPVDKIFKYVFYPEIQKLNGHKLVVQVLAN